MRESRDKNEADWLAETPLIKIMTLKSCLLIVTNPRFSFVILIPMFIILITGTLQ